MAQEKSDLPETNWSSNCSWAAVKSNHEVKREAVILTWRRKGDCFVYQVTLRGNLNTLSTY